MQFKLAGRNSVTWRRKNNFTHCTANNLFSLNLKSHTLWGSGWGGGSSSGLQILESWQYTGNKYIKLRKHCGQMKWHSTGPKRRLSKTPLMYLLKVLKERKTVQNTSQSPLKKKKKDPLNFVTQKGSSHFLSNTQMNSLIYLTLHALFTENKMLFYKTSKTITKTKPNKIDKHW